MTAPYLSAFRNTLYKHTKKKVLLKVCIFKYFTGKKWQNDQSGILAARKQIHVNFSLSSCHISSPNLMSQNFCFSSLLLLVLSSLWVMSQNFHLSQHWVLVAFLSLSWRSFLLLLHLLILCKLDFLLSPLLWLVGFAFAFAFAFFCPSCCTLGQLFVLCTC